MGIDIWVHSPSASAKTEHPLLTLEDDGYYWFLHPLLWNLFERTGKYIDLYDETSFHSHELDHLDGLLSEARSLVSTQPRQWQVHCATQIHPVKKNILKLVTREEFQKLLDQLESIVSEARETEGVVTFSGD